MLTFRKMHGLGNDFVILDHLSGQPLPDETMVRHLCNRHTGVGCDQLIVLRPHAQTDAEMVIFNPDGSRAGMCGNAARCVVWLLADGEKGRRITLAVGPRMLEGTVTGDHLVEVDMGLPDFTPANIPVLADKPLAEIHIKAELPSGRAVSMGNPHVAFFVPDAEAVPLAEWGEEIEHHSAFPNRVNVEFVQVLGENHLKMRVWERGTGATQACGSGACAVGVLGLLGGYVSGPKVRVDMPGGTLSITWRDGHPVLMEGPVADAFAGTLSAGVHSRPAAQAVA
ncbi:MAG: diaminopimelate epimerase [Proteobacteria bacterium]|nr:diaminopimelate epimerase [Pseudomonadota bacterium]